MVGDTITRKKENEFTRKLAIAITLISEAILCLSKHEKFIKGELLDHYVKMKWKEKFLTNAIRIEKGLSTLHYLGMVAFDLYYETIS